MAVIKTTVAKSRDVRDAALNLNAKAYEVRRTLAAVWDLKSTGAKPPPPAEAFSLDMKNESMESVVGEGDERVKVPDIHFGPGGKYRSIVKLFIHYEFQKPNSWAMGTGWLISPDIFVTAGHCSYDWSHKLGRATEVKAYIGYKGRQSEQDPNVQFRRVQRIVTTEGWIKTKGQKSFDVSFMQVDKPFSGVTPIKFVDTPSQGHEVLGVVGYPGDLSDPATGEKGAFMHEMFLSTEFDLAQQADTMLEYQIDTFGGNSGSPVLRHSDLVSIGAHVYGGTYNSASVIGKYGNPYYDYIAAFGLSLSNDALNLIPVTGNTTISAPVPAGYGGQTPASMAVSGSFICEVCKSREVKLPSRYSNGKTSTFPSAQPMDSGSSRPSISRGLGTQYGAVSRSRTTGANGQMSEAEEGLFMDILKKAASVGAPLLGKALNTALPIALGPIGGPVGALAGFALNAAGRLAESADAESLSDGPISQEGSLERAIMAEAALSTIQSMQLPIELEESIFTDMKSVVMKALPVVRKAAPHVMGAMMEPALRIALDSLHKYNQTGGAESYEDYSPQPFHPNIQYSHAIDQPVDRNAEAFLKSVHSAMQQGAESAIDGESEEAFLDIIKAGIRFAGKGLAAAAKHGLPLLVSALPSAESFGEESTLATDAPQAFSADVLAHRALVAEAALQAVMKIPPQQLEEEGFFDFISNAVKTIAPVAMKVAPGIVSAINPTVGNILKGVLGQESAMVGSENPSTSRRRLAAPPKLTAKKSLASLREHHQNGTGDHHRYGQGAGTNGYAQYGQGGY